MPTGVSEMSISETTIFGLGIRNQEAEEVIGSYSKNHSWLDVGVGIVGTVIPGAGLPAMFSCMAAQGPLFYRPMAARLSQIYLSPRDMDTNGVLYETWYSGAIQDMNNAFNIGFFAEVAVDLASEIGWGAAATFIPLVGGLIGAGLDARVAATMTWRVGTMISIYYQNGGDWLGSRRETFDKAKDMVGPISMMAKNRVKLDDIPLKNKEVLGKQFHTLKTTLLDPPLAVSMDREKIVATLRNRGIPEGLMREADAYIRDILEQRSKSQIASKE